jgi:hypothetical protein
MYYFVRRYILQQGFRDGWRGFVLAVFTSMTVFTFHAKLYEMQLAPESRNPNYNQAL